MSLPERLVLRLTRRFAYSVVVALLAVLGGQVAALLGFLFIVLVTGLSGASLLHVLVLLAVLVSIATLIHLLRGGWLETPLTHPACRRINVAWRQDEIPAADLPTLTRDLEGLPGLYTRIAAVLSSLVVILAVLDAALRGAAWGWYALGGALAVLLYVTYASTITELAMAPALRRMRHRLALSGQPLSLNPPGSLDRRMARLLVPVLTGTIVLTALFGQRPELARNGAFVILLGGSLLLLTFALALFILSTIRMAHVDIQQAVRSLMEESRADFVTGSTDVDFVLMAQDIYTMARHVVATQQSMYDLNQSLEEHIAARVAELEQKQQMLAAILDNIAEGLVVTDREGRLVITNEVFRTVFPLATDASTTHLAALFPNTGLHELLQQALQVPERAHELQLVAPDRHVYRVLARALPAHTGLGAVLVLHDITRDVELAHMKTNFISSVSHELRTPLTSILGFAKLTRRTLEQLMAALTLIPEPAKRAFERLSRNLDILIQESERLTHLINDVLDLAAMDSGKLEWNDVMCEPAMIIEESVAGFREAAEKKGLRILVDFASPLPLIKADPLRVRQVLDNLLSNAIKFTSAGWVKVSARALQAGEKVDDWITPESGGLLISVADTGPGVPLEYQPYIFERFWQGGDYIHDKPKGTGLGLALSRDIVRHYQGHIAVRSEPSSGAVFYFALPAGEQSLAFLSEEKQRNGASSDVRRPDAPACIVAVDDDPAILEWLRQELEQRAYRVLSAKNAAEGMTLVRLHHPDAIVLDLMMPGISGLEVLRLLKADATTASIPVVVLTIADEREASMALGAAAYLKKPVDSNVVAATLEQVIQSARVNG